MAGHNKWSKIARKKGVNDQKRAKIFSKIIKEITVAAKIGGADPVGNVRLKSAISTAKSNNMPKDIVERAIKKGSGAGNDVNYEETTYEGYGPGGTAIMVKCLTDNKTRTVSEVRHIITKYGGNLGAAGSVNYLFDKLGIIEINKSDSNEDQIMEIALDAGAEDVKEEEETFDVITTPENFEGVKEALEKASIKIASSELTMVPQTNVNLDKDKAETTMKILELLEDLDDVQNVYSNFDFEE